VSSTSTTTYAPISAGTSHIAELWHELLDVLHEKYPAVSARMSKIGASEVEITTAEEQMHVVLPDSYKNLLRIYNADGSEEGARFCSEYFLQPLDSVVEEWLILAEALDDGAFDELEPAELGNAARAIRCVWWSKAWIPIGREPGCQRHHWAGVWLGTGCWAGGSVCAFGVGHGARDIERYQIGSLGVFRSYWRLV
jgi:cell wall assembly regulator SMI1